MTMEFPLSARVTIASLFWSLDRMFFIVLASCCGIPCVGWVFSIFFSVFIRDATRCLYVSRSDMGSFCIAVSASSARSCIQFFCLVCRLYFRPFCNRVISLLEKCMSVLFITLG